MGAAVPARHGRLRGRALGQGSTATVYLATATSSPLETFAVKSAELSRSAPLQREHGLLSSLCSPHLVSCLGADVSREPDGRVFYNLLMEYVPGGTIAEEIKRRGGLDEGRIRQHTRGILHGLAYLHSMGIAHCDVKGQNMLLGADGGFVKLADLGCAKWVGGRSDAVNPAGGRTGKVERIGGTPLYMAPEVARGEEQGTAADIWALGCTVIEMATGRPPWPDASDPVAAIHRISFSTDVPEFPWNFSSDARDFLGRCLRRDPAERWMAQQLLSHPFLRHCNEEKRKKDDSPRSTLEQGFWDSWVEEEEEVTGLVDPQADGSPSEPPEERLRQLIGGSLPWFPAATSTWDDSSWIAVRSRTELGGGSCSETSACDFWAVRSDHSQAADEGFQSYQTHGPSYHCFKFSDGKVHSCRWVEFNTTIR